MKTIILVLTLVFQQSAPPPFHSGAGHPAITPSTVIRIPRTLTGSALSGLLKIGVENHVPLGIIIGDSHGTDICQVAPNLGGGTMTVAELISTVGTTIPNYQADLRDGVLEIAPTPLPESTEGLLHLKLSHFRGIPESHQLLGLDLWKSIQAVRAPGEGINIVQSLSLDAEKVTGMETTDETVGSLLNMIVDKGNGGVWILNASQTKVPAAESSMPYNIYGYVGGEGQSAISNLTCPN